MTTGNPQIEDGYTKIADEILEALIRYRIPGEQMQCLLFIIRKTYGWGKKEDCISLSQFVEATGMKKPHIVRALNALRDRRITVTKKGNTKGIKYRFNKIYNTWKALPKKVMLPKKVIGVTKKGNKALPKKGTTIDTRETITKENFSSNSIELELSTFLLDLILERNPNHKKPNLQKWAVHVDRMIRLDHRLPEHIRSMICWCQNDTFWQNNILSTEKLREQFDQLYMKMDIISNAPTAKMAQRAANGEFGDVVIDLYPDIPPRLLARARAGDFGEKLRLQYKKG